VCGELVCCGCICGECEVPDEQRAFCEAALFVAVKAAWVAAVVVGVYELLLMLRNTSAARLVVSRVSP
jgi:hypothetical protein